MRTKNGILLLSVAIMSVLVPPIGAAPPSSWDSISSRVVKLFYPGQSSFQWLRKPVHKKAYKKVRQGESCLSCHEEDEEEIGDKIVTGEMLEPNPIDGKPGSLDLSVQAT